MNGSPRFYNRTRRSPSLPRTMLRHGRLLSLPVYAALRQSDLAREGLDHSGSYRFADHIYRAQPSGRGPFGRWLDARLLALPAVRSFRNRFCAARDELAAFLAARATEGGRLDILSAPCGIPRELAEAHGRLAGSSTLVRAEVRYYGLDLDTVALADATRFARDAGLAPFIPLAGDVFDESLYPPEGFDFITCTGLAEFLDDDRLLELYGVFFRALRPEGMLVTTGMKGTRLSDYLLRLAEISVHYRTAEHLERLVRQIPFRTVRCRTDALSLQAILVAHR